MPTGSEQGWRYLDFERSEDETGVTTFEAMASVGADRWVDLQAEVTALLSQLYQSGAAQQGPLDEGATGTLTCRWWRMCPPLGGPLLIRMLVGFTSTKAVQGDRVTV